MDVCVCEADLLRDKVESVRLFVMYIVDKIHPKVSHLGERLL